jgi:hypothetical protein
LNFKEKHLNYPRHKKGRMKIIFKTFGTPLNEQIVVPEGEGCGKETQNLFYEIIAENFPNLWKYMDIQVLKAHKHLQIDMTRNNSYINILLSNCKKYKTKKES